MESGHSSSDEFLLDPRVIKWALDACDDAIVIKDSRGTILHVTPRAASYYGRSIPELIGKNSYAILPPEVAQCVGQCEQEVFATGQASSGREYWKIGEKTLPFLVSRSPFRNPDGEVVGVIAVYRQISELEEAIRVADRNRERLRVLADMCPVGIFECQSDGRVIYANPAWETILGLSTKDGTASDWIARLAVDDRERVLGMLRGTTPVPEPNGLYLTIPTPQGSVRFAELFLAPTKSQEDSESGWIGSVVDWTDHRAMEEDLRRANELLEERVNQRTGELQDAYEHLRAEITTRHKAEELLEENRHKLAQVSRVSVMGLFATELAHELNQPLYAIQNYLSGLRRMLGDVSIPELAEVAFQRMSEEVERAARILRHTRDFLSSGPQQSTQLDLNQLCLDTIELMKSEFRRRGAKIVWKSNTGPVPCEGNDIRLQQILVNLMLNALDAMADQPESQRICTLELRLQGDQLILDCQDFGPGVSEADQKRLFDTFFTTKPTGLGMGLAICQTIALEHRGQLSYVPNSPHGSVFRLTLPASKRLPFSQGR
jgi:PAS domain S-box-containing protein